MIVTRTPLRVSFSGGGTDLPCFYEEEEGAVLSSTINQYIYIFLKKNLSGDFLLSYGDSELCRAMEEIRHPIISKVLLRYQEALLQENPAACGLEIASMSDVPSGTGLGSSSSFTTGLLLALRSYLNLPISGEALAEEAARVEIVELGEPIGKQDQYAAAFGGLNFMRFQPNGQVSVEPIELSTKRQEEFERSSLLLFTGLTRPASKILATTRENFLNGKNREALRRLREVAYSLRDHLVGNEDLRGFGELLHEGWMWKKSLSSEVSNGNIDQWYETARSEGAWGGKVLGAGGGGFLYLMCPPERREAILAALPGLQEYPFQFSFGGSEVLVRSAAIINHQYRNLYV